MDQATLVEKDIRIGNDIIGLLTAAGIPVVDAFWAYMPEIEEWRLILTSPKVQQIGVRNAYLALSRALNNSRLVDEIPLRRLSLLSPKDQLVRNVRTRLSHSYEGSLHIVQSSSATRRAETYTDTYMVTFAPHIAAGGAIPMVSLDGKDTLRHFLVDQAGVDAQEADRAIEQLGRRGSFSFPKLRLNTSDLRRLRLLPSWPRHAR
jgi:hypothetical protein